MSPAKETNRVSPLPPVDLIFRYNPDRSKPFFAPSDWREATAHLERGNRTIVRFIEACRGLRSDDEPTRSIVELSLQDDRGQIRGDDGLPRQRPFALVIGCADARVPTELLFGQEFNDIFNIRVAGNILAEEGVGSLLYALRSFVPRDGELTERGLKLAAVIGHRGCGAVEATVRLLLDPLKGASAFGEPIGAILRRIASPPLVVAVEVMNELYGPGAAVSPQLIRATVELTVYLNAAWVAHDLQDWVVGSGPGPAAQVGVVYGVFDPSDYHVRSLPATPNEPEPEMFAQPPRGQEELRALALTIARKLPSEY